MNVSTGRGNMIVVVNDERYEYYTDSLSTFWGVDADNNRRCPLRISMKIGQLVAGGITEL